MSVVLDPVVRVEEVVPATEGLPGVAPLPVLPPEPPELRVLRAAHELLKAPGLWCQHAFALDANGLQVAARDSTARRWCATGAIDWAAGEDRVLSYTASSLLHVALGRRIVVVNDQSGGYQRIMAGFEKAIGDYERGGTDGLG